MPGFQSRTYANPRRLPRRNHYQEGPGFLFVVPRLIHRQATAPADILSSVSHGVLLDRAAERVPWRRIRHPLVGLSSWPRWTQATAWSTLESKPIARYASWLTK